MQIDIPNIISGSLAAAPASGADATTPGTGHVALLSAPDAPSALIVNAETSGGGAVSLAFFAGLWLLVVHAAMRRRWARVRRA